MSRLVFTGRGTSGSWVIRGIQLAEAMGVDAIPRLRRPHSYDAAVIVKRPEQFSDIGVPFVYDIVDAWPQPHGNLWDRATCMEWLQRHLEQVKPVACVGATLAMARDIMELGYTATAIYHHANPNHRENPIRETVTTVGYEGAPHYLGDWREFITLECAKRGWRFVMNCADYAQMDIVLALRQDRGYAAVHWKSNVKLANAQGTGTPCILVDEAGYRETQSGAEVFVSTKPELAAALDYLTPYSERLTRSATLRQHTIHLSKIAANYKEWLQCTLGMRF